MAEEQLKEKEENREPEQKAKKRSPVFIILLVLLVLVGGYFGYHWYQYSQSHETTDDAQIEANISPVISKVAGYIKEIRVQDNQFVHKGDTLLILDQRDLSMNLDQAKAALATAKSNLAQAAASSEAARMGIGSTRAAVATADAQIQTAKVNVTRTAQDLARYKNLIADHSITQQQYEQAEAAHQLAVRQLQVLVDQKNQAHVQTGIVQSQSNATGQQISVAGSLIKQREVDVETAKLMLSYTVLTAAESGTVTKVPVQVGQLIQAGQSLFSIVLDNEKWIIANFKETQINHMLQGQKVTIHADAFPRHDFEGTVASFSPATGNKFSILPADNATGNFVKTVQRLPVKIEFTQPQDSLIKKLRAGMNVIVEVHLN
ncbi:MAG: secretion protein HlyD [Niastella sp. SCN 39-18]|nr:HlyD family secretion protein [Sphingobacteriales bacterium]ODT52661.1 MAG: secretion protein HlyD [Niastella sp. SCN 39-18]OJW11800.1 MAG: secretion protein HlyD [Sphingobacteriales bacterium 39-19]